MRSTRVHQAIAIKLAGFDFITWLIMLRKKNAKAHKKLEMIIIKRHNMQFKKRNADMAPGTGSKLWG